MEDRNDITAEVIHASYEWTITYHQIANENQQKERDDLMELVIQCYKENDSRNRGKQLKKCLKYLYVRESSGYYLL